MYDILEHCITSLTCRLQNLCGWIVTDPSFQSLPHQFTNHLHTHLNEEYFELFCIDRRQGSFWVFLIQYITPIASTLCIVNMHVCSISFTAINAGACMCNFQISWSDITTYARYYALKMLGPNHKRKQSGFCSTCLT